MEKFIQLRLEELQSGEEMRHMVVELSAKIATHKSRVRQVLRGEPLRHTKVAQLIMVGMVADQPLESNFFPGLLEGLLVLGPCPNILFVRDCVHSSTFLTEGSEASVTNLSSI